MQCSWFISLADGDVAGARGDLLMIPEEWNRGRFLLQNVWALVNNVDIELYDGKPLDAWKLVEDAWPRVTRSMFLRAESMRVRAKNARARAALGAAGVVTDTAKKRALLALVTRTAKELARERWPLAAGYALLLEAGVLALGGDKERASGRLRAAIAQLESKDGFLYAASARIRLGQLLGGSEGEALVAGASKEMNDERIVAPEMMANVFVPFAAS
jgi:hypothetical protein